MQVRSSGNVAARRSSKISFVVPALLSWTSTAPGGPRREVPNHLAVLGLRFEGTAHRVTPSFPLPPPPSHICLCIPHVLVVIVVIIVAIIAVTSISSFAVFMTVTTTLVISIITTFPSPAFLCRHTPHMLRGLVGSSIKRPQRQDPHAAAQSVSAHLSHSSWPHGELHRRPRRQSPHAAAQPIPLGGFLGPLRRPWKTPWMPCQGQTKAPRWASVSPWSNSAWRSWKRYRLLPSWGRPEPPRWLQKAPGGPQENRTTVPRRVPVSPWFKSAWRSWKR